MASWTDNFNRGTGIGANWTGSVGGDLAIQASTVCTGATGAADNSMYWNANTPADAQYAQAVLVIALGQPDWAGVCVRASATDWVFLDAAENDSAWRVEWYNGGSWTQIGSTYSTIPANGDLARMEADGSAFEGFVNGVSRISGSNGSAPASGFTGAYVFGNAQGLDDFEGGDLAAVFNDGVTESASATTVQDAIADYHIDRTEATAATDASVAALVTLAAITEAGSATETPSGLAIRVASDTEATSATDAEDALAVRQAAIAEDVSAAEEMSAQRILADTVSEAASAIASQDFETGAAQSDVTEAAEASESCGAVKFSLATATEIAQAQEAITAAGVLLGAVVEIATPADGMVAELFGNVSIVETALATDLTFIFVPSQPGSMLAEIVVMVEGHVTAEIVVNLSEAEVVLVDSIVAVLQPINEGTAEG